MKAAPNIRPGSARGFLSRSIRVIAIAFVVLWNHAISRKRPSARDCRLNALPLNLDEALRSVGEVIGVADVEQILDSVFSQFCIGKMSDHLKFRKHVCLALKALCHRKPGASPQESLSAKAPALKARFKSRHWFSIPNITFVEIHAMPAQ